MTGIEHDGRASLRVEWLAARQGRYSSAGWYVVRTCQCHHGLAITAPLDSRIDAEMALAMLDDDAQQRWGDVDND